MPLLHLMNQLGEVCRSAEVIRVLILKVRSVRQLSLLPLAPEHADCWVCLQTHWPNIVVRQEGLESAFPTGVAGGTGTLESLRTATQTSSMAAFPHASPQPTLRERPGVLPLACPCSCREHSYRIDS